MGSSLTGGVEGAGEAPVHIEGYAHCDYACPVPVELSGVPGDAADWESVEDSSYVVLC